MPDTIPCTFFANAHDRNGVASSTTWERLAERLTRHDVGTKDGPAITCGSFNGPRGNAACVERSLVALDVETSTRTGEVPIDFEAMAGYLSARRVAAALYTTHSHTTDAPRYRIIMPLSVPVPYDPMTDIYLSSITAAQLRCHGVADASKFGMASLMYLPRHNEGTPYASRIVSGDPIDVGMLVTAATTVAERCAADEAEIAARRRANAMPPALMAKIHAYNDTHPIADLLVRFGYRREGNRFKSPAQHGAGATTLLPGGQRWVSFSQSDADANVGAAPLRSSSQCTAWGDAFQLFVRFEHNGNFRAALAALPDVEMADAG